MSTEDEPIFRMVVPVSMSDLIASLESSLPGDNGERKSALISLIKELDSSIGEWDFTLRLVASLLPEVMEYAVDEQNDGLRTSIEEFSGRLARALRF